MLSNPKWNDGLQTIKNLRELSWMLRNQQEWEDEWEWNSNTVDYCGTAGCALGLWDTKHGHFTCHKAFDDMPYDDFRNILYGYAYMGVPLSAITPLMVADEIDEYILEHTKVQEKRKMGKLLNEFHVAREAGDFSGFQLMIEETETNNARLRRALKDASATLLHALIILDIDDPLYRKIKVTERATCSALQDTH